MVACTARRGRQSRCITRFDGLLELPFLLVHDAVICLQLLPVEVLAPQPHVAPRRHGFFTCLASSSKKKRPGGEANHLDITLGPQRERERAQTSRRALDADVREQLLRSLHTCLQSFHEFEVRREPLRDHGMHAPLQRPGRSSALPYARIDLHLSKRHTRRRRSRLRSIHFQ